MICEEGDGMEKMKYKYILDSKIMNLFPEKYKEEIEELTLSTENGFFINVKEICRIIKININENIFEADIDLNDSGSFNDDAWEITINSIEPLNRQRFTIAHELGHALLKHKGVSFRTKEMKKYKNIIKRMEEVEANKFAASLLMPKILVKKLLSKAIHDNGYDANNLDQFEVEQLIKEVAKILIVSEEALSYSIENYKILSDKK